MFKPTKEQATIVETAETGCNIAVSAKAGAAKTSTCVLIAEALVQPSLYVAFNKSIAEEASEKFPEHVECRTMHSIAYRAIVTPGFRKKLNNFLDFGDIEKLKSWPIEGDIDLKLMVADVITKFCQSASYSLISFITENATDEMDLGLVIPLCSEYWDKLVNDKNDVKITHDVYLKLFQLSKPDLTTHIREKFATKVIPYQTIYLDEAQDSNPVTLDIILNQKSQIILVGDEYQSIYEWRGAVNAMQNLPDDFVHLYLTESFRFTQDIADLATRLTKILGNTKQIIGRGVKPANFNEDSPEFTKAIIVRNNSTLLDYLLEAYDKGEKVYVVADLNDLWSKLYHISALMFNSEPKYPNKELAMFNTFKELTEAAQAVPELSKLLNLSKNLSQGAGLHTNISNIKKAIVSSASEANYTLTTCHKSKGLEYDVVTLDDDLLPTDEEGTPLGGANLVAELVKDQVGNLLYVAITRAKYKVYYPAQLQMLFAWLDQDNKASI